MVHSLIKNYKIDLFKKIYFYRKVELEISSKYSEQKMRCPTHLSIGQESISAAFALCVKKKDFAVSGHRAHLHYLAKGSSLKKMIAEIYGKQGGCSKGKGGSMHLIDIKNNFMGSSAIVGNSIPTGVGLGLSLSFKKNNQYLSFVFIGDGAVEEGVFFESANFAALNNLPVVFICENNLYSVYTKIKDRQPSNRKIYKMVEAVGIKSFCCQSSDPIKIYEFMKKKIDFARKIQKPIFLEFSTYRYLEHCGPNNDDNLKYRPKKEIIDWLKKDPLNLIEKIIKKDSKSLNIFKKKIDKQIKQAFDFAENDKFPNQSEAYNGIYAEKFIN